MVKFVLRRNAEKIGLTIIDDSLWSWAVSDMCSSRLVMEERTWNIVTDLFGVR